MHTRATVIGILGVALLLAGAGAGTASTTMYIATSDYASGGQSVPIGSLLKYDPISKKAELVGTPLSGKGLSGIDFNKNGELYGTTWLNYSPSQLLKINPLTGGLVDNLKTDITGAFQYLDKSYPLQGIPIVDIAFHPNTGVLYGLSDTFVYKVITPTLNEYTPPGLFTINTTSGAATLVGWAGIEFGGGLAFTPNGNLYMTTVTTPTLDLDPIYRLQELYPADAKLKSAFDISYKRVDNGKEFSSVRLNGLGINPDDGFFYGSWDEWTEILKGSIDVSDPNSNSKWGPFLDTGAIVSDVAFQPVPIPGALLLLGSGLAALAVLRRRQ